MRFSSSALLTVLAAASTSIAQRAMIGFPTNGTEVQAGSDLLVMVARPVSSFQPKYTRQLNNPSSRTSNPAPKKSVSSSVSPAAQTTPILNAPNRLSEPLSSIMARTTLNLVEHGSCHRTKTSR
ncbi:hypothetical protein PM082_004098 [Marasmius tenuissimus]|nr:hypothetical protein PM082_004098 [Marasmius tenuissimus]